MVKKVYVLIQNPDCETHIIEGVFTTRSKAKKEIPLGSEGYYFVEEWVMNKPRNS